MKHAAFFVGSIMFLAASLSANSVLAQPATGSPTEQPNITPPTTTAPAEGLSQPKAPIFTPAQAFTPRPPETSNCASAPADLACQACAGEDDMIAIGTGDHDQHVKDAELAKSVATANNDWFSDPNGLTIDTNEAAKVLDAISKAPSPIRRLVVAIHGHGEVGALDFTDGSTLKYKDMFKAIKDLNACQVYFSNDSCYSGSMFTDLPADGLAKCVTVAAASTSATTTSPCTNGLSNDFMQDLKGGQTPSAALAAAATSAKVRDRGGDIKKIENPACKCKSDQYLFWSLCTPIH